MTVLCMCTLSTVFNKLKDKYKIKFPMHGVREGLQIGKNQSNQTKENVSMRNREIDMTQNQILSIVSYTSFYFYHLQSCSF